MKKIYVNNAVYGVLGDTDVDCPIPNVKVGDFLVCVNKETEEVDDFLVLEKDEGENLFYSMLEDKFYALNYLVDYYYVCCVSKRILEEYLSVHKDEHISILDETELEVDETPKNEDRLLHELSERNLTEEQVIKLLEIVNDVQNTYNKSYDDVLDDIDSTFKFYDKYSNTIDDYSVCDADDLENRLGKSSDYDDLRSEVEDAVDSIQSALDRY